MTDVRQNWLGESPVFYNLKTGRIAGNINDVIDFANMEICAEGLHYYLMFGYSALGTTPVKDVYFLRPNEVVGSSPSGTLTVSQLEDPCLQLIDSVSSEKNAWDIFSASLQRISQQVKGGRVCLPISGGYDSRLLAYFYPDKPAVQAFTYGISRKQEDSFESVNAWEVSRELGLNWNLIKLGSFNQFIPDWLALYGASTHAHGMYHWEFYSKIRDEHGAMPVISGIVGDAWAGSVDSIAPKIPQQLVGLGYAHGLIADSSQCLLPYRGEALDQEFDKQRELLSSERYRALYLVRTKMILLSYLMKVPSSLGMTAFSPFVEFDVAMSMLTIEPSRWKDRLWQTEFLERKKLDVERSGVYRSFRNDQDFDSMKTSLLPPLSVSVLREFFDSTYLEWINSNVDVTRLTPTLVHWLLGVPKVGGILRRLGVSDQALKAYSAYLVIKPIEDLLLRRIAAQQGSGV